MAPQGAAAPRLGATGVELLNKNSKELDRLKLCLKVIKELEF